MKNSNKIRNVLISQFLNLLVSISCFAAEEIRLPDINIMGEDLSIYGISDLGLKRSPETDKEKYITREFEKRQFRSSQGSSKNVRCSFSAGNRYFSQWALGISGTGGNSEAGFLTSGGSKFLNTDGRKNVSSSADFFYKRSDPFVIKIEPAFAKRIYEVPETSARNISVSYLNAPFSVGLSRNNLFTELCLEPEILKGSYPEIFYLNHEDASFSSSKMSGRLNVQSFGYGISGGAFVSPNRWDWVTGEKKFMHVGGDFSAQMPMPFPPPQQSSGGGITLNPSVRFEKWDSESYFLGGLVVDIPLETASKISAGVRPRVSAPRIYTFLSTSGGVLKQFPKAAYDNYRSFFVNFSHSAGVSKYKLEVSRRETQNFLYVDESSSAYGTFETGEFKRYEFEASAGFDLHGITAGFREKYRTGGDLFFAARNEISYFCELSAGKFDFNFLATARSKKEWVGGYVHCSVKICYNLARNFRIFCTGNNVFDDKIYYSRYEFLEEPIFMSGIEAKF
ncbi:MAG: hypothetical protein ABIJ15_09400 [bacterium]